jgi:tetratricopeptide (TPR) repeat protein
MKKDRILVILLTYLLICACSGLERVSDANKNSDNLEIHQAQSTAPKIAIKPFSKTSLYELLVGDFALARNQLDVAQTNYQKQARQTSDIEVIKLATKISSYNRDYAASEQLALLWIQQQPNNREARIFAIEALAAKGDGVNALTHISELYTQDNQLDTFTSVTSIPKSQQEIENLIVALENLEIEESLQPATKLAQAMLHKDRGNLQKAQELAQDFLNAKPMNEQGILLLSQIYRQREMPSEAMEILSKALKTMPENTTLRQQYARYLVLTDRSLAMKELEYIHQLEPQNSQVNFILGVLLLDIRDLKRATKLFLQTTEDPNFYTDSQYYLGVIADTVGTIDLAIDFYSNVKTGPNFSEATINLTSLLAKHKGLEVARDHFQSLRTEMPERAIELFQLEVGLLLSKDLAKQAYQLLSDSLHQLPNDHELLYTRAMVATRQNNHRQAEKDLRKILSIDSDNAIALNALGYSMLEHSDQIEEAYKLIQQAFSLNPDDPATIDSMGWALFRLGQPQAALAYLKKAMELMPDPEIAAHIGEVEWSLGNRNAALKIWQDSLQKNPKNHIIMETIERLNAPIDLDAHGAES